MNLADLQSLASERQPWLRLVVQLRGSVVPAVLPRALLCGAFGVVVTVLNQWGLAVSYPNLALVIPNFFLGLLLVFRTNTAYERFWEGRRFWGSVVNDVRNLARLIWVVVDEQSPGDHLAKEQTLRLLVAFAVAMKLHLRQEPPDPELARLVTPAQFDKLKTVNNLPLEIAFWLGDYLQVQYRRGCLHIYQLTSMQELLNNMVNAFGSSERILKTPIPLAYAIHLKHLLLLYCLSLPFQVVASLSWLTGPMVTLLSFTVLGIEEIGLEIENPFGRDPNDLPLDAICATMLRNVEDLIAQPSHAALPHRIPQD